MKLTDYQRAALDLIGTGRVRACVNSVGYGPIVRRATLSKLEEFGLVESKLEDFMWRRWMLTEKGRKAIGASTEGGESAGRVNGGEG